MKPTTMLVTGATGKTGRAAADESPAAGGDFPPEPMMCRCKVQPNDGSQICET